MLSTSRMWVWWFPKMVRNLGEQALQTFMIKSSSVGGIQQ